MKYVLFATIAFFVMIESLLAQTSQYLLGNTTIELSVHGTDGKLVYFAPHDDENTAVKAANAVIAKHGGKIFELKHGGHRNIAFKIENINYEVDPNRMFSRRGIKASLASQGQGNVSEASIDAVEGFSATVVKKIKGLSGNKLFVAIHNNSNGAYSVLSYRPGQKYADSAVSVSINSALDPDDFYFVTDKKLYSQIAARGYNVVLQSLAAPDDGSLSVLAGRLGMTYVNVESQHGHAMIQQEMLELLQGYK